MIHVELNPHGEASAEFVLGKTDSLALYSKTLELIVEQRDYKSPEASVLLPDDEQILKQSTELVDKLCDRHKLRHILLIGIGGSCLGPKAIYSALKTDKTPAMHFAETVDGFTLNHIKDAVKDAKAGELLVVITSKSGTTTETIANAEILLAALKPKPVTIVVTNENSVLWQHAGEHKLEKVSIPSKVGGRYSVFSAAGLVPLYAAGFDLQSLLAGAAAIRDETIEAGQDSMVAQTAMSLAGCYMEKRLRIADTFVFHDALEPLGRWYRQLLGESIGKSRLDGAGVVSYTPTVSVGSTDLHSVGQLYLSGANDRHTTFIHANKLPVVIPIPKKRHFEAVVPMLSGKDTETILSAILDGTRRAYTEVGLPYVDIAMDAIDEQSLGAVMQFKMLETMFLGRLLNVNTFDQPNVESYKVITRQLLKGDDK